MMCETVDEIDGTIDAESSDLTRLCMPRMDHDTGLDDMDTFVTGEAGCPT